MITWKAGGEEFEREEDYPATGWGDAMYEQDKRVYWCCMCEGDSGSWVEEGVGRVGVSSGGAV